MAREGTRSTRSQTGNSKPRVFTVVDTAPAIKRTVKPKTATKKKAAPAKAEAKGAGPTGVTKRKAPKKESGAADKVRRAGLPARLAARAGVKLTRAMDRSRLLR